MSRNKEEEKFDKKVETFLVLFVVTIVIIMAAAMYAVEKYGPVL